MTSKKFRSSLMTPEQVKKIEHFNYRDARRHKGPIYDVLIMELYEEGCMKCAYHFTCLVDKEKQLYEHNFIHSYVRNNKTLLMALFENGKMAEKALKSMECDGKLTCMKVLLQTLVMLQAYRQNYHWLVQSIYKIVIGIADKYGAPDLKCGELVAKIYYIYADHFSSDYDKSAESIDYYRKCLQLCRGQSWQTNDLWPSYELEVLQDVVSEHLAAHLIKKAKSIEHISPETGLDLAHQAILTIAGITGPNVNYLLCKALLAKTKLLLHHNRYKEAMKCVLLTEKKLRTGIFEKFVALICELYLYKGQCLQQKQNYTRALLKYKQSVLISRKYKLRNFEAVALLQIGKLCTQLPDGKRTAHNALCHARDIFDELKNLYHKKCSVYLLAQVQQQKHFRNFMLLLKGTDKNYCDLYKLRKWKDQCQPFWTQRNKHTMYKLTSDVSLMGSSLNLDLTSEESEILTPAPSEALSKHISRVDAIWSTISLDCLFREDQLLHEQE